MFCFRASRDRYLAGRKGLLLAHLPGGLGGAHPASSQAQYWGHVPLRRERGLCGFEEAPRGRPQLPLGGRAGRP